MILTPIKNGFNLGCAGTNDEEYLLNTLRNLINKFGWDSVSTLEFKVTDNGSAHPHISFQFVLPEGVTVDEFGEIEDHSGDCQICGLAGGH
jgi:hypothetical protein